MQQIHSYPQQIEQVAFALYGVLQLLLEAELRIVMGVYRHTRQVKAINAKERV